MGLLDAFIVAKLELRVLKKDHRGKVPSSSHNFKRMCCQHSLSLMVIIGGVTLHHMLEVVFVRFFLVSNSSFSPSHSILSLSMCSLYLKGRDFMLHLFEGQNSYVSEMCMFSPFCLFYVYIYLKFEAHLFIKIFYFTLECC